MMKYMICIEGWMWKMDDRLPYYMAYPMPLQFDDERTEKRDLEYMKSLYPDTAKRLLPYVEEECERMEYEGSMMYDEYPDKLQLRLLCSRIYDRARKEGAAAGYLKEELEDGVEAQAGMHRRPKNDWLRELVEVMVFQELYKRRCDHRKCRRRYY